MVSIITKTPSWVLPGAKIHMDFENNRYWGGNISIGSALTNGVIGDLFTVDNGSGPTYAPDRTGVLFQFPQFACRITAGMGVWAEAGSFNYALWNRDLTNAAWVKTNATTTKNQNGADLTVNTASSILATASNATVLQSITLASTSLIYSAYVKRLTGTGAISMTMDGGTTWIDVTSQIGVGKYVMSWIPIQTTTNPVVGFMLATSGDSIAVDFAQLEPSLNFVYPSTPIPTTTVGFPRNNEHVSFWKANAHPNSGQRMMTDVLIAGKPFTYYMKYSGYPVGGGGGGLTLGTDGTAMPVGIAGGGCDGTGAGFAGTITANVGNIGIGNWNKAVGRCNGFGSVGCLNGGALTAYTTGAAQKPPIVSTAVAASHGSIGNNGSGSALTPMNGAVASFALWDHEITDGQMQQFTR